eukprot:4009011-Amphidinium_carterae.2
MLQHTAKNNTSQPNTAMESVNKQKRRCQHVHCCQHSPNTVTTLRLPVSRRLVEHHVYHNQSCSRVLEGWHLACQWHGNAKV